MYYRVAGLKKDDDCREMIVRVNTRQEAEQQIPAAKAFLFPGEDTENYHCSIIMVPIKVNLGTTLPYYRITVQRTRLAPPKEEDILDNSWWETILSAESAEEAKEKGKQMLIEDGDKPDDYDFYADEMTIEECIKDEERRLRHWMENEYFRITGKEDMSVREYNTYRRKFNPDENPEEYYQVLKAVNKENIYIRACLRQCDTKACTVEVFENTVRKLLSCKDKTEFETIMQTLK